MRQFAVAGSLLTPLLLMAGSASVALPPAEMVRATADRRIAEVCRTWRPQRCVNLEPAGISRSKGVWLVQYRSDSHLWAVIVHDDLSSEVSHFAEPRPRR
jgi:hypothetical protein